MTKAKIIFKLSWPLAVFFVWHHYDAMGANVVGVLLVLLFVGLTLRVYFAPIASKRKSIARYKARHGIPTDQAHKVDDILKEGFFRVD